MDFEKQVDHLMNDMIQSIQGLIQIRSVEEPPLKDMPFGEGVSKALHYTLDLGKALGFSVKNIDNYAGYIECGSGSEMIGILGHLDIVPEGNDWDFDPFGGMIDNGRIYGRGTLDDKGPTISALYAMKALFDSGLTLNKRIRLILGLNEETSHKSIHHYLKNEQIPDISFVPDADFPAIHGEMGILNFDLVKKFEDKLNDGGIEVLKITGGHARNMVPDYAEAQLIVTKPIDHILKAYNEEKSAHLVLDESMDHAVLKSYGVSAHGSTPENGRNAVSFLLDFLNLTDLQIGDTTNFIRDFARLIGLTFNGEQIGCGFEDDYGKLVFNVGGIDLDQNGGRLKINVRYPITLNDSAVYNGLKTALEHTNIRIEPLEHEKPLYFEPDHPLISTLMETYTEITGDDSPPITIGGGTYARSLKNAVAFGPLFPGKEDTAHQKNEFLALSDLKTMTHIYANALYKLLQS